MHINKIILYLVTSFLIVSSFTFTTPVYATDSNREIDTDQDGLKDIIEGLELNYLEVDTDGDGISDADEDSDQDGLNNVQEQGLGSDLFSADSDADGITDYDEVNKYHTNPIDPDTDGDLVFDFTELSILKTDPLNPDENRNETIDGEEKQIFPLSVNELDMKGTVIAKGDAYTKTVIRQTPILLVQKIKDVRSFEILSLEEQATFEIKLPLLKNEVEENYVLVRFNEEQVSLEKIEQQSIENNMLHASFNGGGTFALVPNNSMVEQENVESQSISLSEFSKQNVPVQIKGFPQLNVALRDSIKGNTLTISNGNEQVRYQLIKMEKTEKELLLSLKPLTNQTGKQPVVLVHGLNGSSETWGFSQAWTNTSASAVATKDIKASETLSGEVYKKKDREAFHNIDVQMITNLPNWEDSEEIGPYLVDEQGYTPNKDLFIFEYMRFGNVSEGGRNLEQYLKNLREAGVVSADEKFNLLVHSMGGLVARYAIETGQAGKLVDRLITLGTPHYGSDISPIIDLDRKYSYLWRTDSKDRLSGQHPNTLYYAFGGFNVDASDLNKTEPNLRGIRVVKHLDNNGIEQSVNYDQYVRDLFEAHGQKINWLDERDIQDGAVNIDSALGSDMDPDYWKKIGALPSVSILNRWLILDNEFGKHSPMRKYDPVQEKVAEILSRQVDQALVEEEIPEITKDGPVNVQELNLNKPISASFETDTETKWYKITPTNDVLQSATHSVITLDSTDKMELAVYINKATAELGAEYQKSNESITLPLAFRGPYYLKVTGKQGDSFTLNPTLEKRAPEEHPHGGACAVEATTSNEGMISHLRFIREELLTNTENGQQIIRMYNKLSTKLVWEIVKDSSLRNSLLTDLNALESLIKETVAIAEGRTSSYVITRDEAEAVNHIINQIKKFLPTQEKAQLEQLVESMDIEDIGGKELKTFLTDNQLLHAPKEKNIDENGLIVKLKEDTANGMNIFSQMNKVHHELQVEPLENEKIEVEMENTFLIQSENEQLLKKMKKELSEDESVDYVQFNQIYESQMSDVHFEYQWPLLNQEVDENRRGLDLKFQAIVEETKKHEMKKVLIAVIDTGVNYELADLDGQVIPELGYDFVNNDKDAMDDNDHGTHVAGIISAEANNGYSMAGLNQHSQIVPIKVLGEKGRGTSSDIALGIKHAVNVGAKVINLSLGATSFDKVIEEAIVYATEHHVTVVAAAGNDGKEKLSYPASSKHTISVGATDKYGELASFSNYGTGLDLTAPGESIPSLVVSGEVMLASGTSMATPYVAAQVGLLYSLDSFMTPDRVKATVEKHHVDLGDYGYDNRFGWGQLDTLKAMQSLTTFKEFTEADAEDPFKQWTITFNSELTEEEATNSIMIYDRQLKPVAVEIKLGENPRQVIILPPKEGYTPGEMYHLIVQPNIKSSNGKPIKSGIRKVFKIVQ
ncbi:hypothetical protein CD798_15605 [Bacillaceae bacterium SAOS 7]|nr:hypothetical protein CD798_15605 [Bacillaceae bacterium SAOS 7]